MFYEVLDQELEEVDSNVATRESSLHEAIAITLYNGLRDRP